jgi:pyridinium-3,5-bisthiocarboxylic acid mononucleotide nickel chelatase
MHLHLIAAEAFTGDMFIAAGLDAFPRFEARVLAAVDAVDGLHPVTCSLEPHWDREATGQRFTIEPFNKHLGLIPHAFAAAESNSESIRRRLDNASLSTSTRMHARELLRLICAAQSHRQGVASDRVMFEEPAGWNTLAQVAGAAALIDALEPVGWSAATTPASVSVDLTGGAIINYLCPSQARRRPAPGARLARSGAGYGADSNNVVRLLCFAEGDSAPADQRIGAHSERQTRGPQEQPAQ